MLRRSLLCRVRIAARLPLVLVLSCTCLASCGVRKDLQAAEEAVTEFHIQLDSEQYPAIYSATGDGFRKATSEADFTNLLQAIHRKLGTVQNSQRQNFRVNFDAGMGEVVTLRYNTTFSDGSGSEEFLWQIRGSQPVLLGYHINSNALVLK
jgi:hypothetical protein